MKKRLCSLLLVTFVILSLVGCSGGAVTTSKEIEFTYGIAHQDAKDLLNPNRDYLTIVNESHPYDFNGKYHKALQADLVYFPNVVDGDIMAVEKAAYLAFASLQYDLKTNDGILIGLYDGYRTAKDQQFINDLRVENGADVSASRQIGHSEHHTGLLLDMVIWYSEDGEQYDWHSPTPERIAKYPEFRLVYDKMADYGFIKRYPAEKSAITGVSEVMEYEIRFVGSAQVAHEITDNNLCLEEYLAK